MTSIQAAAAVRGRALSFARPRRLGIDVIYGVLLVAVGISLAAWIWRANPNYWYDEAMLVQALRADGVLPPGVPLSEYEQAAPYGVYLIEKLLVDAVGFRENVLRIPGLIAFVTSGVVVWRGARAHLGPGPAWLAGLVTLTAGVAVRQAGQFKHYEFELLAASVIVALGLRLLVDDRRGALRAYLAASTAALLFSNSAVIVAAATSAVIITARLLDPARARRFTLFVALGTLVVLLLFGAWYGLALRPAFRYQLAYPSYDGPRTLEGFRDLVSLVPVPSGSFMPAFWLVALGGGLLCALARRELLPAAATGGAITVAAGLATVLGGVPLVADRHVLFLVPGLAILFACGAAALSELPFRGRVPRAASCAALVIAAYTAWAIVPATAGNGITTRQAFGYALTSSADRCSTWWVDWWSQPAATLYAQRAGLSKRVLGTVSATSGTGQNAWSYRLQDAPQRWQTAMIAHFRDSRGSCLLIGSRPDEVSLTLDPLRASGMACERFALMPDTELWSCPPAHSSPSRGS